MLKILIIILIYKIVKKRINYERDNRSRYEFIDDDDEPIPLQQPIQLQRRASLTRIETVNQRQNSQFHRQASYHGQRMQTMLSVPVNRVDNDINNPQKLRKIRQDENNVIRYALVPADEAIADGDSSSWINTNYSSSRGRYARLPMQDEDPPILPDRNLREQIELRENIGSSRNNIATQKLHEILTTPRKPRSKSEERNLSPGRRTPQRGLQYATPPASTTASPTGRVIVAGSSRRGTPVGTPQRAFSPGRAPQTSTPNKDIPPARRCLPLNEQQELCPASNCGRSRYISRHQDGTVSLAASPIEYSTKYSSEPPPRYAYVESTSESLPMVVGSTKYQVISSRNESTQKKPYNSVENAFIARTAVVPPLSPPNSEANTTFASGLDKGDRKSAPLILVLVGILTCGLAFYLSWTQGRRYYFDSAAGCGICCALAGASRSLRRTWTGFSLAGLATLSCAGLLLIAIKSPRPGSPLHDITAGVLCGVSLLGAGLAILALMSPKCNFGRHRRVHSWIPQFAP